MKQNPAARKFWGADVANTVCGVAFGAAFLAASAARAVIINPGDTTGQNSVPNLTGGFSIPPGALVVPDPNSGACVPFDGLNAQSQTAFSGTLHYEVFHDTVNPNSTLDFVYWIDVTGGPDNPNRLSVMSFANFTTDVDYVNGSGAVAPSDATRGTFNNGQTIGFDFSPPTGIAAGQDTDYLMVKTNSLSYNSGMANLIDGGVASTFVPIPFGTAVTMPLPEPATAGTLAVAAFGLLSRRRRHHAKNG